MSKLHNLKPDKVIKAFERAGWMIERQIGSHVILSKENYPYIGRRICLWIEEVRRQDPNSLNADKAVRLDVERLLAALVSLGVADARRLEKGLAKESGSRT